MDVVRFGPLVLSAPVMLLLAAFLAANGVAAWHRRRHGLQADAGPILWNMMLFGALASRAVFVLRHHDIYLANPLSALDIRDGGFDATVGLIVACAVAAHGTRRHPALRRPAMSAVLAGCAVWFGGTLLSQLYAPPHAPLPEITVRRLDGVEIPLRSYAGQPLVVNLWATWCPPCRREMPVLQAAQRAHPGLAFVFINQGESAETVARFMAAQGLRMANVVVDPGARMAAKTGSPGYPATLFYDARGVMRFRHTGELSEATLREKLRALGR